MRILLDNYIRQYQEIQRGKPWIGSSFKSKLDLIKEDQAFSRPMPDLHSIAEILSHLTLWRKETLLKIRIGEGSKTDACEENWLGNDALEILGWKRIREEYDHSLTELIEALESKDDSFLSETYFDTDFKARYPYRFIIEGMLHHDLYHLGQIGIILKYLKASQDER